MKTTPHKECAIAHKLLCMCACIAFNAVASPATHYAEATTTGSNACSWHSGELTCHAEQRSTPDNGERTLFASTPGQYYRIPAIAVTKSGDIIALSDDRHDTGYDVGQAGKLDVLFKRSTDGGNTWTKAVKLADCDKFPAIKGFGDAAIVADRSSQRILVLAAVDSAGILWGNNGKLGVYRFVSDDGGLTWDDGTCITEQIYGKNNSWSALFFASGKITQSRIIKKGSHYRIYCAALVRATNGNSSELFGNVVFYSDDFGETWNVLGSAAQSPCPHGDEAKIEELPNGNVIISSRTNGRYFNVFQYSDKTFTAGLWSASVAGESFATIGNACNGELMLMKVRDTSTGRKAFLLLQSVPAGPGRRNVTIFYKESKSRERSTPSSLGTGWNKYEVCHTESAYSTMCSLPDGRIAFYYERVPEAVGYCYDMVYLPLNIATITGGRYEGIPDSRKAAKHFLKKAGQSSR